MCEETCVAKEQSQDRSRPCSLQIVTTCIVYIQYIKSVSVFFTWPANKNTINMCVFLSVQDIDDYLCQAKDKSYDTLVTFGRKGLNVAATAAVLAATKVMLTIFISDVSWGNGGGK